MLLLAGVLCLAALTPQMVRADQSGDFIYSHNGVDITLSGYTGPGGAVLIPATINGLPVRQMSINFTHNTAITSVTIPDSVVSIGVGGFYDCSTLLDIEVASGNTAYKSIEGVLFDREVTTLLQYPRGRAGPYTIPDRVISIGAGSFYGCTGLSSVTIPDSVASIAILAFSGCSALLNIEVTSGNTACKSVGGVLFNPGGTTLLQYPGGRAGPYTIPNSVTSIDYYAFYGCTGLSSVTIPASVTFIEGAVFFGCSALLDIEVAPGNPACKSVGGVLFKPGGTILLQYPPGRKGAYTIPASVTAIGNGAFAGCTGLSGVTIPNSVISIEDNAFVGCTGLSGVTIPNSVISIEDNAFAVCTGLTGLIISDGVTSIEEMAFYGCTGLSSVTIPASVTSIEDTAFLECSALLDIEVAPGNPACKSVGGVLFNPGGTILLQYPPGRKGAYTIPASVTAIGHRAFSDCTGLSGVTIPGSITSIEYGAFLGCTGLTGIIIPDNVISIGDYAFSRCTGLTDLTIPPSVTSIAFSAFSDCTGLKAALFQGNAPTNSSFHFFDNTAPGFTISYYEGAVGFTSPTWQGYASRAVSRPVEGGAFQVESLTLESGVAILRASGGRQGWTYTLRRGADLTPATWEPVTTVGPLAADGALELKDIAPPPSRAFYRVTGQSP